MDPDVPSEPASAAPGGPGGGILGSRWAGLAAAVPCWAMLVMAVWLQPRTAGYGTAKQLGVPACSVLAESGYPCPTCGMTTSVALTVRGQVLAAWGAHPFGLVLTAGAAVLAVAGTVQLLTGWPALHRLRVGWWWVAGAVIGVLAGWWWMRSAGVAAGKWPIG